MDPATIVGILVAFASLVAMVYLEGAHITSILLPAPIILVFGALIMICSGVLGELIYKLGDLRERQFSRLTQSVWGNARD